jgi:hypothetical protein
MKIVMVDETDVERKKTVGYINMYTVSELLRKFVETGKIAFWVTVSSMQDSQPLFTRNEAATTTLLKVTNSRPITTELFNIFKYYSPISVEFFQVDVSKKLSPQIFVGILCLSHSTQVLVYYTFCYFTHHKLPCYFYNILNYSLWAG